MKNRYFSNIKRSKVSSSKIFMIVLTIFILLLSAFVIWAAITYGEYSDKGQDAVEETEVLKQQLAEKESEIVTLTKELKKAQSDLKKEQDKVEMLLKTRTEETSTTPVPTPTPTTSPKPAKKSPAKSTPSPSATPSPETSPSPIPTPSAIPSPDAQTPVTESPTPSPGQ